MAVISPALVLSMCVMFILTRLHSVRFTFEHIFFFGLRYVVEPTRSQIATLAASGLSSAAQVISKGGSKKRASKEIHAAKPSVASLPVMRAVLSPTFFATDAVIPHLQQFDHLLAVAVGYVFGVLFEETATCLFPTTFVESHVWWLALFAMLFAAGDSIRICVELETTMAPIMVAAVGSLVSLALITAGDLGNFVWFDVAFKSLERAWRQTFIEKLQYDVDAASDVASSVTLSGRIIVALLAGVIVAAALFPALRFAHIDYSMLLSHRQSEISRKNDPYALPRRPLFGLVLVLSDYLLPVATLFMWGFSARDSDGMYGGMRITMLLACVCVRLACARFRLQLYLDGSIDAFRRFWEEKPVLGVVTAGERLIYFVARNSVQLTTMGMAAVVSPIITLVLALSAKRNGGVRFGMCPVVDAVNETRGNTFVREVAGYLVVVNIASYTLFAAGALMYLAFNRMVDPVHALREKKVVPPVSSSERRRQRRNMKAAANLASES